MTASAKKLNLLLTAGIGFTGFMAVGLVIYGMVQGDLRVPEPREELQDPSAAQVDTNPVPAAVTLDLPDADLVDPVAPVPRAALPTYDGRLTRGGAPGIPGVGTSDAFELRFGSEQVDKQAGIHVEGLTETPDNAHLIGHDPERPPGSNAHLQDQAPPSLQLKKKK